MVDDINEGQKSFLVTMQLQPVNDDPNEYTYNDTYDPGRYGKTEVVMSPPFNPGKNAEGQDDLSDLAIDDMDYLGRTRQGQWRQCTRFCASVLRIPIRGSRGLSFDFAAQRIYGTA